MIGYQVADGAWSHLLKAIPASVRSNDHARIAEYANAWAWKARRHGIDIFANVLKTAWARPSSWRRC